MDEAKREAELVAAKLSKGEGEVLRLTATDRAVYLQALEQLRPFKLPLNVAVLEYTSALKHLPEGAALKEAVDFFSHRNPASFAKSTVRQVADEMLAAKRAANLSPVHLKDLDCRYASWHPAMPESSSQKRRRCSSESHRRNDSGGIPDQKADRRRVVGIAGIV